MTRVRRVRTRLCPRKRFHLRRESNRLPPDVLTYPSSPQQLPHQSSQQPQVRHLLPSQAHWTDLPQHWPRLFPASRLSWLVRPLQKLLEQQVLNLGFLS
jgi:hypothetical protein